MSSDSLPFLRPRSSRNKPSTASSSVSVASPRTEAFQLMNGMKTASKLERLHNESMELSKRSHVNRYQIGPAPTPPSSSQKKQTLMNRTHQRPQQQQQQQQNQSYNTTPLFDLSPSKKANNNNNSNSCNNNPLRSDSAHVWWPQTFDGLAFSEQLEQLTRVSQKNSTMIDAKDVHTTFDALDLVARTLHGTPAFEVVTRASEILQEVCFRPMNNNNQHSSTSASREVGDAYDESPNFVLNRDLVLGLELEVAELRRRLKAVEKAHSKLRESTANQVESANSQRITTDINTAVNSEEVAEATILRVQKESAEMATRLQQSLAQQQMIRSKLIDLGMRNLELRNILEAQKRAATARSWEDVMPRSTTVTGNDDSEAGGAKSSLDRSALLLLGDVVSSSQTELANLVEFRQKLSTAVYGE